MEVREAQLLLWWSISADLTIRDPAKPGWQCLDTEPERQDERKCNA
jgi:hypothetical protein